MTNQLPARLMDTLYDDMWLPDETIEVRKKVRHFADTVMRPIAHELNNTPESLEAFPAELYKKMGDAGILGIPFEKKYGGAGLEYPTLATMVLLEEIAYVSSGVAATLIDVPLILFGNLLKNGSEEVKDRLFPALIRGDIVGAFGTSEPDASTDLRVSTLNTEATKVEGGYRVNGQKRFITNAPVADYMFILCKMDDGMNLLLVDMKAEGASVGEPDKKLGNHCQLTSDVYFKDVFVPQENLSGVEGKGLKAALSALSLGRIGIGCLGVGLAQSAFDFAADYMTKRKIFGKTLAHLQHWQFKWADYAMQLENARNLYVKSALMIDKDRGNTAEMCSMTKVTGSSLACDIARDAIQACGGYGFVKEVASTGEQFPLEAIYRDSKVGEIYEGANEVQRMVIARSIFGREIVG